MLRDPRGYGIRRYCFVFAAVLLVLLGLGLLLFSAARSNSNKAITLAAAGDILLDRGVRVQLEQHGYEYPYELVKDILQKADIAFANLESPLVAGGTPVFKDRTLLLTISSGEWKEARLIPVKIADCQPRPAEGKEGEEILLRLQKYSQGFGTSIIIREGKGYLLKG